MKKAQFVDWPCPEKVPKGKKEKSVVVWTTPARDYLIVDIHEKGKHRYRYVMFAETGEYNDYDYSAKKWERTKLDDLISESMYSRWLGASDVKERANLKVQTEAENMLTYNRYCSDDIFRKIETAETEFCTNQRNDAEDRRQQRIREKMLTVPPVPSDFEDWFFRVSGLDELNYLIYDEASERYKCTKCGKKIPAGKGIKNLKRTACPECGAEVTPRRNRNQLRITVEGHAALFQRIDNYTVVQRDIDLEAVYDVNGRHLTMSEAQRMFYEWKWKDCGKKYDRRLYYAQYERTDRRGLYEAETGFDWKRNPYNRMCFDAYLYPSDFLSDLAGSELEGKAYMLKAVAESFSCVNVARMMTCTSHEDSCRTVEMAAKLGFRRILREAFAERRWWEDIGHSLYGAAGETINFLMDMPKQERNRLRMIDGSHIAYDWLMYAKEKRMSISDEMLRFLDEAQIGTDALKKLPEVISAGKLMHYIRRQQEESYPGRNAKDVYSQWLDYLGMEQKLEKNLQDEMILWPRELKKRHAAAVEECREKEAYLMAKANLERAQAREREICEKFPNAAAVLEKIRDRFAFEDEEYLIRVPDGLYEISQEGYALHHCVGSSDRYFERMDREETYICFLRKKEEPDAPFYTVEVEPGGTIRQHRGMYDEEPELDKVKPFLKKWQQHLHKQLTDRDKELAEMSRAGREKSLAERLLIGGKTDRVYKGLMEDLMEIKEALQA